jgi:phosphoserine aminotransferase
LASISHRSKTFQQIFAETTQNLQGLLEIPANYGIYFLGSANEAWERILENTVSQHSLHFVNGSFSQKFYAFAQTLNLTPQAIEAPEGQGFQHPQDYFGSVKPETELLAFCANETATGVATQPEFIYAFRAQYPEKLIAVDLVSAWPYYSLDVSQVDLAYFSVQKGFGLPAGLGVLAVSPRARKKAASLQKPGTYHTFAALQDQASKNMTPETPNVLGIYLLGKVAGDMLHKGIDVIRRETEAKAATLRQAIQASQTLQIAPTPEALQSQTVIVVNCSEPNKTMSMLAEEHGWYLGEGYGKAKDHQIRIANFPAHSPEVVLKLAKTLRKL